MKMNKILPLAAAVLSVGMLAGCGGRGDNSIKVIFWHTFGDKAEAALKRKAEKFVQLVKENEGVDIKVETSHLGSYNDVYRIVGTALKAGNGPTMTVSYADSVAALMADETTPGQYIVNVQDYFNDEKIGFGTDRYLGDTRKGTSDFIQSYIEEGQTFDREGTYVMPYMKSTEIMLYNQNAAVLALASYKGMTEPEAIEYVEHMSFDELMDLARYCVQNKTQLGFTAMEQPVFYDSDSNMIITQLEQKGIEYSYRDLSGKVVLGLDKEADPGNWAEAKEVLEEYQQWHKEGLITTKATEGTYASDSFKNMKCLFTIGSSGGAGYSFPTTGQFKLGVCRVPYAGDSYEEANFISQGPSIAFLNDKSLSADANATRLKYGWKFYKYITNEANNVELCVNGSEGYVPVRQSCYNSELWAEFIAGGDDYARSAVVVKDKINGAFFNSLVFKGSARYREEMTGLVGSIMRDTTANVEAAIATAVNNTKTAM